MPVENLLTCPRGHRWDPAKAGPSARASVCPVCGAAPQTATEMEAGTLPPRDTSGPDTMHEPPGQAPDAGGLPRPGLVLWILELYSYRQARKSGQRRARFPRQC